MQMFCLIKKSFSDLKVRIDKTLAFIRSVSAANIDGSEDRVIKFKLGTHDLEFTGLQYLNGFALPNFYFHLVTAYNILRHNGIAIGKRDYIGTP